VQIANSRARAFFAGAGPEGVAADALIPVALEEDGDGHKHAFSQRLCEFLDGDFQRVQVPLPGKTYFEFDGASRADGGAVVIFEDVSARVRAEEKILHMAKFDALTGLSNRHHFAEQVRLTLERLPAGVTTGFLLIDVDDLKNVNDMRGHAFGDRVLNEIGRRFAALTDSETITARMISDQFGVFLFGRDGDELAMKARILKFHAALQGNYTVGDVVLPLTYSAGYVLLPNREAETEEWQVKADLALSEAKGRARGLCVGYAREMDERYIASRRLKADLRQTLLDRGLTTMFQPMYTPDGISNAARRLCAGRIPSAGRSAPTCSSAWPRIWGSFPPSPPSCWSRPAANACAGRGRHPFRSISRRMICAAGRSWISWPKRWR
jgi:diguanylate cyclase (GGDEF)-like protein